MNVFLIEPASVIVPLTLYVAPSLLTKPSPETTTVLFVNACHRIISLWLHLLMLPFLE